MTATMISAVSSRMVCWLPAVVSAFTAAGPVTAPASPAGALAAGAAIAARMAVTASRSVLPELACPVMFTVNATALPSAEACSGPGAASPVTWPASPATAVRAAVITARSAGVRGPFPAAKTTMAALVCGCPPVCSAACWSRATLVEAAEAGR